MLCASCSKLTILPYNKTCIRCRGHVAHNLPVICETCSTKNKQCSVCLKSLIPGAVRSGGCGCGKK